MIYYSYSDLVDLGRSEDGEPMVGEAYYVCAEEDDGRRWSMFVGADKRVEGNDDEGHYWISAEKNRWAESAAKRAASMLEKGYSKEAIAKIYNGEWRYAGTAYGSPAHDEFERYDEDDWAIFNRGY